MSYSVSEHTDEQYIHVRFFGEVDDDALMKYQYIVFRFFGQVSDVTLAMFLDDALVLTELEWKGQLVDYLEVTSFMMSAPGIFTFCNDIDNHYEKFPHLKARKLAIVTSESNVKDVVFIGSVFASEMRSLRNAPQIEFFKYKKDALDWLG